MIMRNEKICGKSGWVGELNSGALSIGVFGPRKFLSIRVYRLLLGFVKGHQARQPNTFPRVCLAKKNIITEFKTEVKKFNYQGFNYGYSSIF